MSRRSRRVRDAREKVDRERNYEVGVLAEKRATRVCG